MAQSQQAAQPKLSAQERAALFSQNTRQYFQTLPSQQVTSENTSVDFLLPKARLLSKIILEIEAVATLTSTAGNSIALDPFSPYQILRRVELDLNNGFMPFVVAGRDLYMYNTDRLLPEVLKAGSNARGMNYVENSSSTTGTDNNIKLRVELPVQLNERDPVGLVLLQNEATNVRLSVAIDTLAKAYTLNASNGDTVTFKSMTITPVLETYSIPSLPQARPDLSVLKLVSTKKDIFTGNGQNVAKLNVGTIYRKLFLYFEDNSGNPLADTDFNGNLELVFNQADIPYSIKPSVLAARNTSELGETLADGMFMFDFSYQGIPNLGGSRDYVNTEELTEFWVRFNTSTAGTVTAISETLSRLQQG